MSRPGQEGGGDGAMLPDVLGLKHHDGTPITLESCLMLADRLAAEVERNSQEREGLLCNFEGDPREAALLEELEDSILTGRKVEAGWLGLAEVFRAVES